MLSKVTQLQLLLLSSGEELPVKSSKVITSPSVQNEFIIVGYARINQSLLAVNEDFLLLYTHYFPILLATEAIMM